MTLWEVFDAQAELIANPPIHLLFADYLSVRYGGKARKGYAKVKKQGSAEELRQLARTHGKGQPNG